MNRFLSAVKEHPYRAYFLTGAALSIPYTAWLHSLEPHPMEEADLLRPIRWALFWPQLSAVAVGQALCPDLISLDQITPLKPRVDTPENKS